MENNSVINSDPASAPTRWAEGGEWIQGNILCSMSTGKFRWLNRERGEILPAITGTSKTDDIAQNSIVFPGPIG
jgi:hypothetical protein